MNFLESDVVLCMVAQADGQLKKRPALLLRKMPSYNDFLVCGISTQLKQALPNFDMILDEKDKAFAGSGLLASSVLRLGFLGIVPESEIKGKVGSLPADYHALLLSRLAEYLLKK